MNPVRRISESLREMRWAQVILELALLVLGILIALAVDGWMEDRRDARLERQYLELLVRDLDRDLEVLEEFKAFEDLQVADSVVAYRALRAGGVAEEDREAVAVALNRLTTRRTLRLTRATYTDLLGTGNLRLIRTPALRDRIVRLYEANERNVVIRDRNNQVFVDEMYSLYLLNSGLVAPRPGNNLETLDGPDQEYAERVAMPIETTSDRLWRLPEDSPELVVLINKVWQRGRVSNGAIAQAGRMTGETRQVRDAIASELARRWPN